MKVITLDETEIEVQIVDEENVQKLITKHNGYPDNTVRKVGTSRTYRLSTDQLLIEFYNKQGIVLENIDQFNDLSRVEYVKNTIDFLKKSISYKIKLTDDEILGILKDKNAQKVEKHISDNPVWYDYEVYRLLNGQLLFWDKSKNNNGSALYPDIKTLVAQVNRPEITELEYGSDDDEYLMKRIALGDALLDYEWNFHFIYPEYLKAIIKNHKLKLVEEKIYVDNIFYSNLYRSENNYYITIDDFDQYGVGSTQKIEIATLRTFESIEEVRSEQKRIKEIKNRVAKSEHLVQKLSVAYREDFIESIPDYINKLSHELNIDPEQLTFDSKGIEIVDQALKWNIKHWKEHDEWFDRWFPSVLAFYGECYITEEKDGKWKMNYYPENNLWVPEVVLADGTLAWDYNDFGKSMFEGPVPLKEAGDWDGSMKKRRLKRRNGR